MFTVSGAGVSLSAAAKQCTGTATHAAFWVLSLSAAGQSIEVPIFVDTGPAGGASYALTLCLSPSDVPNNNPQRSPFGAKLFDATVTVNGVFKAPCRREALEPDRNAVRRGNREGEHRRDDRGAGAQTAVPRKGVAEREEGREEDGRASSPRSSRPARRRRSAGRASSSSPAGRSSRAGRPTRAVSSGPSSPCRARQRR